MPEEKKTDSQKKKAKPPAVEEKPFEEFISQHFVPSLQDSLTQAGIEDMDLTFAKKPLSIQGMDNDDYWQVQGCWQQGKRQFLIAFQQENIAGPKFYAAADYGASPTTLESFMIDERKVKLDLMVMYVIQRLNAQKWLTGN
ncbi:MAG: DUF2996 domain-containing protein [Cyanothece sp. SIO2G6]|nr:DUF2996 domain-containing protein [Cyanothece sp. SIO2G6]